VKFGAICDKRISPLQIATWCEALSDLDLDAIDVACAQLEKTWTSGFLPTPGNVREQITRADAAGFALETEREWQYLLDWVRRYFIPDIGVAREAPALPPDVEHAALAAGGFRWLESCAESELQWARRRFGEALANLEQSRASEHLLTRAGAKRILASLARPVEPKRLPAPSEKPPASEPAPAAKTAARPEAPEKIATGSAEGALPEEARPVAPGKIEPAPAPAEIGGGFEDLRKKLHAPRAPAHEPLSQGAWEARRAEQLRVFYIVRPEARPEAQPENQPKPESYQPQDQHLPAELAGEKPAGDGE